MHVEMRLGDSPLWLWEFDEIFTDMGVYNRNYLVLNFTKIHSSVPELLHVNTDRQELHRESST